MMTKRPELTVVDPGVTGIQPPRKLKANGSALWARVQAAYIVDDPAGVELLALACEAIDRAESCREQIDRDGEVLRTRGIVKEHPALKYELQNRAFAARALGRLGLDAEPLRPHGGRPGL